MAALIQPLRLLLLVALISAIPAWADSPSSQLIPVSLSEGAQMGMGYCPCFRWSVQLELGSGQMVTRDFLISSEALFGMRREANLIADTTENAVFQAGAIEALWKGGHLGLGFEGVTWGNEADRSYEDVLRTGLYAFVNLILTESARLDIRTAQQFERMRVNSGTLVERVVLEPSARFRWRSGNWSGWMGAGVGFNEPELPDAGSMRVGAAAGAQARVLTVGDLQLSLGLRGTFERDPLRWKMGLYPNQTVISLFMDWAYVPRFHAQR